MKRAAFIVILVLLAQSLAPLAAAGQAEAPVFTKTVHARIGEYPAYFKVFRARGEESR